MTKRETDGTKPETENARPDHGDGEGFLGRWARRKSEARAADLAPLDGDPEAAAGETDIQPDERPQPVDPPAFDVESLPDIDSLGPGSDFSVFMQAGVPSALKTKALRKLWLVKPELANLDGLLDYGEDLTGSFKVVDHLKTAYQVGKGFLKDDDIVDPDEKTVVDDGDQDLSEQPMIKPADDDPIAERVEKPAETDEVCETNAKGSSEKPASGVSTTFRSRRHCQD